MGRTRIIFRSIVPHFPQLLFYFLDKDSPLFDSNNCIINLVSPAACHLFFGFCHTPEAPFSASLPCRITPNGLKYGAFRMRPKYNPKGDTQLTVPINCTRDFLCSLYVLEIVVRSILRGIHYD